MRPFSFAFAGVAATILFLSGCGTGVPEGSSQGSLQGPPTAEQRAALTIPCAACAFITDPGQKRQCETCCGNPNAFAGCGAAGSANPLFDTASCTCVSGCTPPAKQVGSVCCGAGGQICKLGTTDVCVLPGTTPAPGTVCTPVCPAGTSECNNACVNLLTDNANCGTCGHTCTGTNVTCSGGGTPGVCGCTPQPDTTTCAGHCGGTVVANNCGQPVTCNAYCGLQNCNLRPCDCGFDLICSAPGYRVPGFFQCCHATCGDICTVPPH
jgi:hypothetical protein